MSFNPDQAPNLKQGHYTPTVVIGNLDCKVCVIPRPLNCEWDGKRTIPQWSKYLAQLAIIQTSVGNLKEFRQYYEPRDLRDFWVTEENYNDEFYLAIDATYLTDPIDLWSLCMAAQQLRTDKIGRKNRVFFTVVITEQQLIKIRGVCGSTCDKFDTSIERL